MREQNTRPTKLYDKDHTAPRPGNRHTPTTANRSKAQPEARGRAASACGAQVDIIGGSKGGLIVAAVALVLLVILLGLVILQAVEPLPVVTYNEYTVRPGDTLWEIARESNGYGHMDSREILDDIRERSGCDQNIQPGQILYIPVYAIN